MIKKLFFILVTVLLVFSNCFVICSAHNVYMSDFSAEKDKMQIIKVNISENSGIMGFQLHFAYNEEYVQVLGVTRGELTQKGSFMSNVGMNSGGFDVIWNNTSDIVGDGTIAIISIKPKTNQPFEIYISYSGMDTFNENWEEVQLNCNSAYSEEHFDDTDEHQMQTETLTQTQIESSNIGEITQQAGEVENTTQINITTITTTVEAVSPADDLPDNIGGMVISGFVDSEDIDINDLTTEEKDDVVESVNEVIKDNFGIEDYYENFDRLTDDYVEYLSNELISGICLLQPEKSDLEIIKEAMDENSVSRINKNNVRKIMLSLEKKGLKESYLKNMSEKDIANTLNSIIEKETTNSGNKFLLIITSTVLAILFIFFTCVYIRRKERNKL